MFKTQAWIFENNSLKLQYRELRELKQNEILLKNIVVGLNPVDYKLLDSFKSSENGQIMGLDGTGMVVYGDSEMMGKRYVYHTDLRFDGSFSQYTIVSKNALIRVPDELDDITASALPCPGLSAMQALDKLPNLKNKKILVNGSGAVAKIFASLAIQEGAELYVISHPSEIQKFLELGAVECFESIPKNRNFFCIFDTKSMGELLMPLIAYNGHYLSVLGRAKDQIKPFSKAISLHEIALGAIYVYGKQEDFDILRQNGEKLLNLAHQKKILLPEIDVIDFAEIPQWLDHLKRGNKGRKIVARI